MYKFETEMDRLIHIFENELERRIDEGGNDYKRLPLMNTVTAEQRIDIEDAIMEFGEDKPLIWGISATDSEMKYVSKALSDRRYKRLMLVLKEVVGKKSKIELIKICRDILKCRLTDAKHFVDALPDVESPLYKLTKRINKEKRNGNI